MDVGDGGLVHCGMGRLGFAPTGAVTMTVADSGSTFVCDDWLDVGSEGVATLYITDSASLFAPEINIGHEATADGVLSLHGGVSMTVSGSVYIGGDADAAGGDGRLSIQMSSTATVHDSIQIWDAGRLQLWDGELWVNTILDENNGETEFTGGVLHVDQYYGDLVAEGSTVAPGQSAGVTTVHGRYRQSAGKLEIEIESEGSHDRLEVLAGGDITLLGGDLTVRLLGGFVPDPQASFTIATCEGTRTGRFDNAASYVPVDGGGYFAAEYGPTSIILSGYSQSLPGDIDGDGDVDQADLGALLAAYGALPGDPKLES